MSQAKDLALFLKNALGHASPPANRLGAIARFAYRQAHKRVVGKPLLVRWEGYVLEVPPDAHYAASAFYLRWPDFWELSFLDRYLRPGDCVVDVGANVGVYSMFLARRVGAGGRVFACEPDPTNLQRLRKNLDKNRLAQVHVVESAVGERVGTVHFGTGQDTLGFVLKDGGGSEVPITTFDSIVHGHDPVYVKVDVEGYEAEVIQGAQQSMSRGHPHIWQVELFGHGDAPERARMASHLFDHGYQFYRYDPKRRALIAKDYRREYHNLFAIRDVDAVLQRLG